MKPQKLLLIVFALAISFNSYSQDPSYTSFHNNRLLFNPSLVGTNGTQSLKARAKSQWFNDGGGGFKTVGLQWEETVPCSIIDIGAKFNANEEGSGRYRTLEAGILTSIFRPFTYKKINEHNIRLGGDFSWGQNNIDYSRLVWSDQLDKKYGVVLPTSFVAPNGGSSTVYFNPGVGVSLRSLWNKHKVNAVMTNIGLALYRFYNFSGDEINQSVSVLGLDNANPYRITAFAEAEFIPKYYGRKYVSMRPSILYQKQGKVDYIEAGFRAGYTRRAGLGFYYHASFDNVYDQTKWITATTDFQLKMGKGKLLEINLSYSENLGGLKNFSGPQFEIGFTYHLNKSSLCNILGQEDDVPYTDEYKCPIMTVTPGKRKMYENIWGKE
jgi:type IX secretion system PorP/SprF family membrane protein